MNSTQTVADPTTRGLCEGITVRWCVPGRPPRRLDSTTRPSGEQGVLWVDLASNAQADQVLRYLQQVQADLTLEQVVDLLERDELPRVDEHADGLRHASMVGVGVDKGAERNDGIDGELVFQMAETIVGADWLATCWQASEHCDGVGQMRDGAPILVEVVDAVEDLWTAGELVTAGDCAIAIARQFAMRYRFACSMLDRWVQEWELAFHAGTSEDPTTLKRLLAMVNESRRRLTSFANARYRSTDDRWFGGLSSTACEEAVDQALEKGIERLKLIFEHVRADMELVCMERMVRQAEVAEARAEADSTFQDHLGKITALLLVPTLIAGIFGANTALPGGGSWSGFDAMVLLMVLTSTSVYLFMVRGGRRRA